MLLEIVIFNPDSPTGSEQWASGNKSEDQKINSHQRKIVTSLLILTEPWQFIITELPVMTDLVTDEQHRIRQVA